MTRLRLDLSVNYIGGLCYILPTRDLEPRQRRGIRGPLGGTAPDWPPQRRQSTCDSSSGRSPSLFSRLPETRSWPERNRGGSQRVYPRVPCNDGGISLGAGRHKHTRCQDVISRARYPSAAVGAAWTGHGGCSSRRVFHCYRNPPKGCPQRFCGNTTRNCAGRLRGNTPAPAPADQGAGPAGRAPRIPPALPPRRRPRDQPRHAAAHRLQRHDQHHDPRRRRRRPQRRAPQPQAIRRAAPRHPRTRRFPLPVPGL
jgi:hypothetical protein